MPPITPPPGYAPVQQLAPPPGYVRADAAPAAPRAWGDVPGEAARNIVPSAKAFAGNIAQAVTHPIDTAKAVGNAALGGAKNLLDKIPPDTSPRREPAETPEQRGVVPSPVKPIDTTAADAVGKFYTDRYGSLEGFKSAIATDPVGVMADFASVLVPGGGAMARAPGIIGKAGKVVETAGKLADPLSAAGAGAKTLGKIVAPVARNALGATTGAGSEPLKSAFHVGLQGTEPQREAFKGGMRGGGNRNDALDAARSAVAKMREGRSGAYRGEMSRLGADKTQLDFAPVQQAFSQLVDSFHVDGGLSKAADDAQGVLQKVQNTLAEWEAEPAAHTVNGLDGLKQKIRGIYEAQDHTQSSHIVGTMEKAVKGVIESQAPEYAAVMDRYSTESNLIREIEKALSVGNGAQADTGMRKLQSVMRNNVQTNYGNRLDLVNQLENFGGDTIRPSLAGQALNSPTPRGLAALGPPATYIAALALNPKLAMALPATSPRLVGEATYAAGDATGKVARLAQAMGAGPKARGLELGAFQAGRANQTQR